MRKILAKTFPLLLLTNLLIWTGAAPATAGPLDETRSELKVGVGLVPVPTLVELYSDIIVTAISLGSVSVDTETKNVSLFAEYSRSVGTRTDAVAHFNYNRYEKTYASDNTHQAVGTITDDYFTLMFGLKQYLGRHESFALYMDLMAGVSLLHPSSDTDDLEASDETLFAYQFTPLGLRFGKDLALDFSLGFGYKGLLMVSAGYSF